MGRKCNHTLPTKQTLKIGECLRKAAIFRDQSNLQIGEACGFKIHNTSCNRVSYIMKGRFSLEYICAAAKAHRDIKKICDYLKIDFEKAINGNLVMLSDKFEPLQQEQKPVQQELFKAEKGKEIFRNPDVEKQQPFEDPCSLEQVKQAFYHYDKLLEEFNERRSIIKTTRDTLYIRVCELEKEELKNGKH